MSDRTLCTLSPSNPLALLRTVVAASRPSRSSACIWGGYQRASGPSCRYDEQLALVRDEAAAAAAAAATAIADARAAADDAVRRANSFRSRADMADLFSEKLDAARAEIDALRDQLARSSLSQGGERLDGAAPADQSAACKSGASVAKTVGSESEAASSPADQDVLDVNDDRLMGGLEPEGMRSAHSSCDCGEGRGSQQASFASCCGASDGNWPGSPADASFGPFRKKGANQISPFSPIALDDAATVEALGRGGSTELVPADEPDWRRLLRVANEESDALRAELAELKLESASLEHDVVILTKRVKAADIAASAAASAEKEREAKTEETLRIRSAEAVATARAVMQEQLESLRRRAATTSVELQSAREEAEGARMELDKTRGAVDRARAEAQSARRDAQALRVEVDLARGELERAERDAFEARRELKITHEVAAVASEAAAAMEEAEAALAETSLTARRAAVDARVEIDAALARASVLELEKEATARSFGHTGKENLSSEEVDARELSRRAGCSTAQSDAAATALRQGDAVTRQELDSAISAAVADALEMEMSRAAEAAAAAASFASEKLERAAAMQAFVKADRDVMAIGLQAMAVELFAVETAAVERQENSVRARVHADAVVSAMGEVDAELEWESESAAKAHAAYERAEANGQVLASALGELEMAMRVEISRAGSRESGSAADEHLHADCAQEHGEGEAETRPWRCGGTNVRVLDEIMRDVKAAAMRAQAERGILRRAAQEEAASAAADAEMRVRVAIEAMAAEKLRASEEAAAFVRCELESLRVSASTWTEVEATLRSQLAHALSKSTQEAASWDLALKQSQAEVGALAVELRAHEASVQESQPVGRGTCEAESAQGDRAERNRVHHTRVPRAVADATMQTEAVEVPDTAATPPTTAQPFLANDAQAPQTKMAPAVDLAFTMRETVRMGKGEVEAEAKAHMDCLRASFDSEIAVCRTILSSEIGALDSSLAGAAESTRALEEQVATLKAEQEALRKSFSGAERQRMVEVAAQLERAKEAATEAERARGQAVLAEALREAETLAEAKVMEAVGAAVAEARSDAHQACEAAVAAARAEAAAAARATAAAWAEEMVEEARAEAEAQVVHAAKRATARAVAAEAEAAALRMERDRGSETLLQLSTPLALQSVGIAQAEAEAQPVSTSTKKASACVPHKQKASRSMALDDIHGIGDGFWALASHGVSDFLKSEDDRIRTPSAADNRHMGESEVALLRRELDSITAAVAAREEQVGAQLATAMKEARRAADEKEAARRQCEELRIELAQVKLQLPVVATKAAKLDGLCSPTLVATDSSEPWGIPAGALAARIDTVGSDAPAANLKSATPDRSPTEDTDAATALDAVTAEREALKAELEVSVHEMQLTKQRLADCQRELASCRTELKSALERATIAAEEAGRAAAAEAAAALARAAEEAQAELAFRMEEAEAELEAVATKQAQSAARAARAETALAAAEGSLGRRAAEAFVVQILLGGEVSAADEALSAANVHIVELEIRSRHAEEELATIEARARTEESHAELALVRAAEAVAACAGAEAARVALAKQLAVAEAEREAMAAASEEARAVAAAAETAREAATARAAAAEQDAAEARAEAEAMALEHEAALEEQRRVLAAEEADALSALSEQCGQEQAAALRAARAEAAAAAQASEAAAAEAVCMAETRAATEQEARRAAEAATAVARAEVEEAQQAAASAKAEATALRLALADARRSLDECRQDLAAAHLARQEADAESLETARRVRGEADASRASAIAAVREQARSHLHEALRRAKAAHESAMAEAQAAARAEATEEAESAAEEALGAAVEAEAEARAEAQVEALARHEAETRAVVHGLTLASALAEAEAEAEMAAAKARDDAAAAAAHAAELVKTEAELQLSSLRTEAAAELARLDERRKESEEAAIAAAKEVVALRREMADANVRWEAALREEKIALSILKVQLEKEEETRGEAMAVASQASKAREAAAASEARASCAEARAMEVESALAAAAERINAAERAAVEASRAADALVAEAIEKVETHAAHRYAEERHAAVTAAALESRRLALATVEGEVVAARRAAEEAAESRLKSQLVTLRQEHARELAEAVAEAERKAEAAIKAASEAKAEARAEAAAAAESMAALKAARAQGFDEGKVAAAADSTAKSREARLAVGTLQRELKQAEDDIAGLRAARAGLSAAREDAIERMESAQKAVEAAHVEAAIAVAQHEKAVAMARSQAQAAQAARVAHLEALVEEVSRRAATLSRQVEAAEVATAEARSAVAAAKVAEALARSAAADSSVETEACMASARTQIAVLAAELSSLEPMPPTRPPIDSQRADAGTNTTTGAPAQVAARLPRALAAEISRLRSEVAAATREVELARKEAEEIRARAEADRRVAKRQIASVHRAARRQIEAVRAIESGRARMAETRAAQLNAMLEDLHASRQALLAPVALPRAAGALAGGDIVSQSGMNTNTPLLSATASADESLANPSLQSERAFQDGGSQVARGEKAAVPAAVDPASPWTPPPPPFLPTETVGHEMGDGSRSSLGQAEATGDASTEHDVQLAVPHEPLPAGPLPPLSPNSLLAPGGTLRSVEDYARTARSAQLDDLRGVRIQLRRAAERQAETDRCQRQREAILARRQRRQDAILAVLMRRAKEMGLDFEEVALLTSKEALKPTDSEVERVSTFKDYVAIGAVRCGRPVVSCVAASSPPIPAAALANGSP